MNLIVIDTETGGLDYKKHSLLSIGLIFIKDGEIISKKEFKIKHDTYNVTPGALSVNKIDLIKHDEEALTKEYVSTMIRDTIKSIYEDSEKPAFLGHNLMFDLNFVYEQLISKETLDQIASYRILDTAVIGRFLNDIGKIELKSYSLTKMLEQFNVNVENEELRHSALFDAEITWELYKKFIELGRNDD